MNDLEKLKIAYLHHANDHYYTEEQMTDDLKPYYIEFIEKSEFDKYVLASKEALSHLMLSLTKPDEGSQQACIDKTREILATAISAVSEKK